MTAGTLQNLSYTYDSVGNTLSITDSLAGPQVQSFTYDTLDRLTSADAVGGLNGLYSETYGYDANTGNLASKGGNTYTYGDTSHAHAVTSLSNGNTYSYEANGNQITRVIGVDTYSITYDAENRLTTVLKNGQPLAAFTYDGDGTRVASTINGVTTKFVGEFYEVTPNETTKHYSAYGQRVAVRENGTLTYILGDHLGGTNAIINSFGQKIAENWYLPFGEVRYSSGALPTGYTYTGQYTNTADIGWMFYKARWYDPALGRFAQADTIIPKVGNPQSWDRYSYVKNNPILYNDPSGHCELVCVLALIMGGGAIVGAVVNIHNQYQENQSINIDDVIVAATEGAVIAGGVLIGVFALTLLIPAVSADGNPINEIEGIKESLSRGYKQEQLPGIEEYLPGIGQDHHFLTNKNDYWSPIFKEITDKYNLDLNGSWNIRNIVSHIGRHTDEYWQWTYQQLLKIDKVAQGDPMKFLELFEKNIIEPVQKYPRVLSK